MVVLERKKLPEPSGNDSSHGKHPESSKARESHDVGTPYTVVAVLFYYVLLGQWQVISALRAKGLM